MSTSSTYVNWTVESMVERILRKAAQDESRAMGLTRPDQRVERWRILQEYLTKAKVKHHAGYHTPGRKCFIVIQPATSAQTTAGNNDQL